MPQLDPAPWFPVLILAWASLLIIVCALVVTHTYPDLPGQKTAKMPTKKHWAWPWQ
uniref:ATP synthase F0 subunit 8 n=1 Tax=Centropomus parallelus TaxID=28805 RepID=UPI0030FEA434